MYGLDKKLSCRREAARCFVFICSQLQHTYSAVFLLLVTAASDLLVHKILLNYVLLSPIVSGGVQPKPPGQTPLGHNPLLFAVVRGSVGSGPRFVGRIGLGVRVIVSFQQKCPPGSVLRCSTAAENGGYDQRGLCPGGDLPSSPAYNVKPVTNTSSSSCANNGRRGECSMSRLCFSHFATRTVDNTVELYCLPHLHSIPPLGGLPVRILPCRLVRKN